MEENKRGNKIWRYLGFLSFATINVFVLVGSIVGMTYGIKRSSDPVKDELCGDKYTWIAEVEELENMGVNVYTDYYHVKGTCFNLKTGEQAYWNWEFWRLTDEDLEKYGIREAYENNSTIMLYTRCDPNCVRDTIGLCSDYHFTRQYEQYNYAGYLALAVIMSIVLFIDVLCSIGWSVMLLFIFVKVIGVGSISDAVQAAEEL